MCIRDRNTSQQDYDPQGASVTMLIAEEEVEKQDVVMHLDKSHITAVSYTHLIKALIRSNPGQSFL